MIQGLRKTVKPAMLLIAAGLLLSACHRHWHHHGHGPGPGYGKGKGHGHGKGHSRHHRGRY